MDGTSKDIGSRAGIILTSLAKHKLNCIIIFKFKATNNVAKYEVLLVGLQLAKEMLALNIKLKRDSQ